MFYDYKRSHIVITQDIGLKYEELASKLKETHRVVGFVEDEFKLEHAKAVVAEAYVSEAETKYIILASQNFNIISQNSLLKLLEEPPRNIEFIIISPSKSNLLPTIRSRMPLINEKTAHKIDTVDLNLSKIDYAQVFSFLKESQKLKKTEAKKVVEALYHRAVVTEGLVLSQRVLNNFDMAYRLLELNAKAQSVLAMLIMSFVGEKNAS